MNEFIQKNRGLLRFYYYAAKIIGWVMIAIAPFITIESIYLGIRKVNESHTDIIIWFIRFGIVSYLCVGFILLGLALFIKYLYVEDAKPGWILRNFEKFLYLYAFFIATDIYLQFKGKGEYWLNITLMQLITLVPFRIISTLTQVLIIIGLGYIVRKVLHAVEESKTIV